ncbi:hypothetical protein BT67DRAFT_298879 [Trichocladium antarcticum]|uniref:Uncharacterized protein n=1 Tax=Trichocladium antarcticum TaxID=1450529 RepID=A0AAN6UL25_9PEZI|nr:hypothetical protein BT67DRAFT_298879 [Trichocladium antarcticum]
MYNGGTGYRAPITPMRFAYETDDEDDDATVVATVVPSLPKALRTPHEPSEVSYYSLTNLPADSPHRTIPAAVVRAQAQSIPAQPSPNPRGYPHRFRNAERLDLASPPPVIEHPLTATGAPYAAGTAPGPARIFTSELERDIVAGGPGGGGVLDVGYHDPTLPLYVNPRTGVPARFHPFSLGQYRGGDAGRYRDLGGPEGQEGVEEVQGLFGRVGL